MLKNRIRELRKQRGYTIAELAARVHTSQQQLSRLEKGERQLTASWLERIAAALECPVTDLIADDKTPQHNKPVEPSPEFAPLDYKLLSALITALEMMLESYPEMKLTPMQKAKVITLGYKQKMKGENNLKSIVDFIRDEEEINEKLTNEK